MMTTFTLNQCDKFVRTWCDGLQENIDLTGLSAVSDSLLSCVHFYGICTTHFYGFYGHWPHDWVVPCPHVSVPTINLYYNCWNSNWIAVTVVIGYTSQDYYRRTVAVLPAITTPALHSTPCAFVNYNYCYLTTCSRTLTTITDRDHHSTGPVANLSIYLSIAVVVDTDKAVQVP